jgi:uncharacterized protein YhfF
VSLLFKDRHIPLIREGTKTATRRDWDEEYPRPDEGSVRGAVTEMFTPREEIDCWIRILDVYQEPLGEMDHDDARKEGGYNLEDFEEAWRQINGDYDPEQVVDVVEFAYVGRSRPGDRDD